LNPLESFGILGLIIKHMLHISTTEPNDDQIVRVLVGQGLVLFDAADRLILDLVREG
jgi:hypothetical protein